jgi:hypothetical protein
MLTNWLYINAPSNEEPHGGPSIWVTLSGMITLVSWFPANAEYPIWVTLLPIITLVSWLLPNAFPLIWVTLSGMITLVSWFPANAEYPIWVTLLPMVTLVSWTPENAPSPMCVTGKPRILDGILITLLEPKYPIIVTEIPSSFRTALKSLSGQYCWSWIATVAEPVVAQLTLTPGSNTDAPRESLLGTTTLVNWLPLNAPSPIEITLLGMITLVIWFPQNAPAPIEVTLDGMVTVLDIPPGHKTKVVPSLLNKAPSTDL